MHHLKGFTVLPDTHEAGIKVGLAFFQRMAAGEGTPGDLAQLLGPALKDTPKAHAAFYSVVVATLHDYVQLKRTPPPTVAAVSTVRAVIAAQPELVERVIEFTTDSNGMISGAIVTKKVQLAAKTA